MAKHLKRDFELLTEILKEKEPRKFKEGEIYNEGATCLSQGRCSSDCSFSRVKGTSAQPILFCCKYHGRIHGCGDFCRHKITSHECVTCEWTGEDLKECLIAEEVNQQMTMVCQLSPMIMVLN